MKKLIFMGVVTLCCITVLAVGNSQADVITTDTIDFDDIPGTGIRSWSGDRYLSDGVLFSTDGLGLFAFDASYTNTTPNYIYGGDSGSAANQNVIVDFLTPTDYVEFYLADVDTGTGDTWTAEVFDSGLNSLGSLSGDTNDEILLSFDVAGISRLVFTPSTDLEGIDTLSFAVPEPATVLLLGVGIVGVGMARRKRRS